VQFAYKHSLSEAHWDGAAKRILVTTAALIQEIDLLLQTSALRDELLVKIVVICLFSVHLPALLRCIQSRTESVVLDHRVLCVARSCPESAALILLFGVMNK